MATLCCGTCLMACRIHQVLPSTHVFNSEFDHVEFRGAANMKTSRDIEMKSSIVNDLTSTCGTTTTFVILCKLWCVCRCAEQGKRLQPYQDSKQDAFFLNKNTARQEEVHDVKVGPWLLEPVQHQNQKPPHEIDSMAVVFPA